MLAEQGGGVWLRRVGKGDIKMRLARRDEERETVGLFGSKQRKYLFKPEPHPALAALPKLVVGPAAALMYTRMFTGDALFANSDEPRASFMLGHRQANPWDHLPGLFLLQETGGVGRDWFGRPYEAMPHHEGVLAAVDQDMWNRVKSVLRSFFASPAFFLGYMDAN